MAALLEGFGELVRWMAGLPPQWMYAMILTIAYLENIIPPIPGDMIVVFGGYLVGAGDLEFVQVALLSAAGGAAGFMTVYVFGYWLGDALLDPDRFGWIPADRVGRARAWLERYGYGLVAANRFLSGLRSVISLTVGMARLPAGRVAAYATLSAAVWCTMLVYLGYVVGENWQVVGFYLSRYGRVVLAVAAAFAIYKFTRYLRGRREPSEADSADEL